MSDSDETFCSEIKETQLIYNYQNFDSQLVPNNNDSNDLNNAHKEPYDYLNNTLIEIHDQNSKNISLLYSPKKSKEAALEIPQNDVIGNTKINLHTFENFTKNTLEKHMEANLKNYENKEVECVSESIEKLQNSNERIALYAAGNFGCKPKIKEQSKVEEPKRNFNKCNYAKLTHSTSLKNKNYPVDNKVNISNAAPEINDYNVDIRSLKNSTMKKEEILSRKLTQQWKQFSKFNAYQKPNGLCIKDDATFPRRSQRICRKREKLSGKSKFLYPDVRKLIEHVKKSRNGLADQEKHYKNSMSSMDGSSSDLFTTNEDVPMEIDDSSLDCSFQFANKQTNSSSIDTSSSSLQKVPKSICENVSPNVNLTPKNLSSSYEDNTIQIVDDLPTYINTSQNLNYVDNLNQNNLSKDLTQNTNLVESTNDLTGNCFVLSLNDSAQILECLSQAANLAKNKDCLDQNTNDLTRNADYFVQIMDLVQDENDSTKNKDCLDLITNNSTRNADYFVQNINNPIQNMDYLVQNANESTKNKNCLDQVTNNLTQNADYFIQGINNPIQNMDYLSQCANYSTKNTDCSDKIASNSTQNADYFVQNINNPIPSMDYLGQDANDLTKNKYCLDQSGKDLFQNIDWFIKNVGGLSKEIDQNIMGTNENSISSSFNKNADEQEQEITRPEFCSNEKVHRPKNSKDFIKHLDKITELMYNNLTIEDALIELTINKKDDSEFLLSQSSEDDNFSEVLSDVIQYSQLFPDNRLHEF